MTLVTSVSHSLPLRLKLREEGGLPTFRSGRASSGSNPDACVPPYVIRTAARAGSQGPFGDGSLAARLGAWKAFLTAETRAEPGSKDQYAVNGSHAVCGGATELGYDLSREPHACPPPSLRAVRSMWLSYGIGLPPAKQTSKARVILQAVWRSRGQAERKGERGERCSVQEESLRHKRKHQSAKGGKPSKRNARTLPCRLLALSRSQVAGLANHD